MRKSESGDRTTVAAPSQPDCPGVSRSGPSVGSRGVCNLKKSDATTKRIETAMHAKPQVRAFLREHGTHCGTGARGQCLNFFGHSNKSNANIGVHDSYRQEVSEL